MNLLIQQGTIVDPSQKLYVQGDILVLNGKIAKILKRGATKKLPDVPTLNAKGLIVAPGFVDMHTHLREPGFEYKETIESGSKAAAHGGFTSIACMANTEPVNDTVYVTTFIQQRARESSIINIFPIGALSMGLQGKELTSIRSLKEAGCVAISDDGNPVLNSGLMRQALEYTQSLHIPVIVHAEDKTLSPLGVMHEGAHATKLGLKGIPTASEEIIVSRDIILSKLTKAHVHFAHVSTSGSVTAIERAKKENLPITAEVTPHHLTLIDEDVRLYDTHGKMSPPLRSRDDIRSLKRALKKGIIDAFATDHAPHSVLEKEVPFEVAQNGVIGLETALPITLSLVHEKVLTLPEFIQKWTLNPARILHLSKGTLRVGADADITIFDLNQKIEIDQKHFYSKSINSPFVGWKCRGQVRYTLVSGKIVYET